MSRREQVSLDVPSDVVAELGGLDVAECRSPFDLAMQVSRTNQLNVNSSGRTTTTARAHTAKTGR